MHLCGKTRYRAYEDYRLAEPTSEAAMNTEPVLTRGRMVSKELESSMLLKLRSADGNCSAIKQSHHIFE